MRLTTAPSALITLLLANFGLATLSQALTIPTVPVGNPGNPPDRTGFGSVPYSYSIAKHEVTNAQYTKFLNVVDPTGANVRGLYDVRMSSDARGGIMFRTAAANGSKYTVKASRDNNPLVFVDWYDAIRFANWLNNGRGRSSTEVGAYTLLGGTPVPTNGSTIARNADAKWWIPSENEWYKAAYHKNDGVTGNYWDYPTLGEPYSDQPPGADAPDASRAANFRFDDGIANGYNDGFAVTGSPTNTFSQNYLTDVGAYTAASSSYGTFDQGGNVWEWNEASIGIGQRGLRGGSWLGGSIFFAASRQNNSGPTTESRDVGFRVANIPEPSALIQFGLSILILMLRRRR